MEFKARIICQPTIDNLSTLLHISIAGAGDFLFGRACEGAQRILMHSRSKIKLAKLRGLYLSGYTDWKSQMGGVPGILQAQTIAASRPAKSHDKVNGRASATVVYGDKHLEHAIGTLQHFVLRYALDADIRHAVGPISTECMTVLPVNLTAMGSSASMSYIIVLPTPRPKFSALKAKNSGITKGQDIAKLRKNMSCISDNFEVVTPDMVFDEYTVPPRIVFVDLPNERFLDQAMQVDWCMPVNAKDGHTSLIDIGLVVYCLGASVDPFGEKFVKFVKTFPSHCQHAVCHHWYSQGAADFPKASLLNQALNTISDAQFPLFHTETDSHLMKNLATIKGASVREGANGLEYRFRGHTEGSELWTCSVDDSLATHADTEITELVAYPEFLAKCAEELQNLTQTVTEGDYGDVEVVCIGSCSFAATEYKATSSTLLRIPTKASTVGILLDCGESTVFSMRRLYGVVGCQNILREVEMVIISHMHPDHAFGLISFCMEWIQENRDEYRRKLCILGPGEIIGLFRDWSDAVPELLQRTHIYDLEQCTSASDSPALMLEYVSRVDVIDAQHCRPSYSLALTLTNGFKFAYSGDTRAGNEAFVQCAAGADLLIHEATFDDSLVSDAEHKMHSTRSQAIAAAKAAKAKKAILTHMGPRYPIVMPMQAGASCRDDMRGWISVAYDGMRLRLRDVGRQGDVEQLLGIILKDARV
ncbi:beta-lactamase-like protein [Limtongia smithiae]|uniref:beta-lactamase-like protein n=1 Tax=Limtongia smithiae TaxID=1125753 RepID=UPI0034CFD18E